MKTWKWVMHCGLLAAGAAALSSCSPNLQCRRSATIAWSGTLLDGGQYGGMFQDPEGSALCDALCPADGYPWWKCSSDLDRKMVTCNLQCPG